VVYRESSGRPWSSGTLRDVRASHDYCGLPADRQLARAMHHQAVPLASLLVAANRMFGLMPAWRIASASATSVLCRLTHGSHGPQASGVLYAREPGVRVTSHSTRHGPQCRQDCGCFWTDGRT